MKVFDLTLFYNENNMLEYRFDIYYDVVDHFIVVESRYDHSGKEKPLYYDEARFERYADKIHYVVLDELPVKYGTYEKKEWSEAWRNEITHRNYAAQVLTTLSPELGDILLISDIDEIINPSIIRKIRNGKIRIEPGLAYIPVLEMYVYNLHTRQRAQK